ncbi:MAG: gliding motility-associated C-terminal domain-containing protein, partial [Bacteroidota bacterium]
GNYTFTAEAVDGVGAMATSPPLTLQVAAPIVPVLTSSVASGLCPGTTGSIQSSGGVSYQWSTGASASSIQIQAAGTYTVTATGAGGCTGTSSIQIQALNAPLVQISSNSDTICSGSQAVLTASGASTYTWSTGAVSSTLSVAAGTYTVTGTASNGCSAVSSALTITNYMTIVPVLIPAGTVVLLQGETIQVQASGLQSYQWNTGSTGSSITISQAGSYTVSGVSANGCTSGTAAIQVNIITTAQLIQAMGPSHFCEGDSLILRSAVSTGNQWNLNGAPVAGATADTFIVTASGVYTVSVLRNGQSISSDPITVQVYPSPAVPVLQDTLVCSGSPALVSVDSLPGFSYTWYNMADLSQAVSTTAAWTTLPLTQTTQWTVTLESPQGCILEQAALLTTRVEEIPQPEFTTQVSSAGGVYSLNCTYTGTAASMLEWSLLDPSGIVQTSTLNNPVFNCTEVGQYSITCRAIGDAGCSAERVRSMYVGPLTKPFVPTTFTPNGDGRNDVFRMRGEQFNVITLEIIDQWGNRVFGGGTQWDGRCADGYIRNGTYLYLFQYADAVNQPHELSGTITVVQ